MRKQPSARSALPPELKFSLAQLGARIRLARKRRGLGLKELAAQMLVAINTLRKVETGDPAASMGAYAAALWALGLHASFDIVGLMRDRGSRKRRVTQSERNDDF